MKRLDAIALLLSLAAVAASYLVADRVFEQMPHIEDEMAYVWQAQLLAQGKVLLPSPPDPKSIMIPFVVDYHGQRFGKYPPGWPLVLAMGMLLHRRAWVNPILAGLSVWLTYRLGQKLFGDRVALSAAALTLASPFFLLNSGSLLSHPWALFLSLAFATAWLDAFPQRAAGPPAKRLAVPVAGLSLGLLALTRPLTALGVALPFFVHGLFLLVRGDAVTRLRLLTVGLLAACVAALVPLWQFGVTGDPWLNPYTLWWKYDKIGFGEGFGRQAGGHSLYWAWVNLKASFDTGWGDFLGWGTASWLFLPFGLASLGRNGRAWLAALVFPSIVLLYMAYWIGSNLYGPRYYYEGFYSVTLVSAAGMFWLADRVFREGRAHKGMQVAAGLLGLLLVTYNLLIYLPARLHEMTGLYGIRRSMLAPFDTAQAKELTPALVIVHFQHEWTEYGGLLELENADLTSPFIFALARGSAFDAALARDFPDRRVVHYYSATPGEFFSYPR
jgi:hypothetical protein